MSCVSKEWITESRVSIAIQSVRVELPVVRVVDGSVDEREGAVRRNVVLCKGPEPIVVCQEPAESFQKSGANAAEQWSERTGPHLRAAVGLSCLFCNYQCHHHQQQQQRCLCMSGDLQVNGVQLSRRHWYTLEVRDDKLEKRS